LEYWSIGVLEYWSIGVLECWSIEVLRLEGWSTSKRSLVYTLAHEHFRMCANCLGGIFDSVS
jgi:hypothetical protein